MKEIKLSKGLVAQVDDDDFEWLNQWKWTAVTRPGGGYAYRNVYVKSKYSHRILMHNLILAEDGGKLPDHIDGNGLNNQRYNLRRVTRLQNAWNRRYRGGRIIGTLYLNGYWISKIMIKGKIISSGKFRTQEEAAYAYNQEAVNGRGVYAVLNQKAKEDQEIIKSMGKLTSLYRGVSHNPARRVKQWRAEIRVDYKVKYLGNFMTEIEAAEAYNLAAITYRGERAKLNAI